MYRSSVLWTNQVFPVPVFPKTQTIGPSFVNSCSFFCFNLGRNLSMASASEDGEDESLTRQVLNMILENNAIRDTAFPYITGYITFNVIILVLLIYISVRISIR